MQFRIKNDLDGLEFPDCQGLFSYLADIEEQAQECFERIVEQMKQAQGIT